MASGLIKVIVNLPLPTSFVDQEGYNYKHDLVLMEHSKHVQLPIGNVQLRVLKPRLNCPIASKKLVLLGKTMEIVWLAKTRSLVAQEEFKNKRDLALMEQLTNVPKSIGNEPFLVMKPELNCRIAPKKLLLLGKTLENVWL